MRRVHDANRWLLLSVASAACSMWVGCGGSAPPQAPAGDAGKTTTAAAASDSHKPDQVVQQFLEAVRSGKDVDAEKWLTKTALTETKKADLYVAPEGTATASFHVGEMELVEGGAQVFTTWTDVVEVEDETDPTKTKTKKVPKTDKIVWLLRQEPEGWRIAGMATTIFEGEAPLVLNFEDPQDMIHQQKMLEQEVARRAAAANAPAVAGKPAGQPPVAGQTPPAGAPAGTLQAAKPAAPTDPVKK